MRDRGCPGPFSRPFTSAVLLGLTALTLLAYAPVCRNDFVNFDDDLYVTDNPHVRGGMTAENLAWAWTGRHAGLWVPLTRMSLQLDAQVYGLEPAGFHRTNLLFHLANVLLLFGVLTRLTRAAWPSTFVAALFAVHPLHVESVAWVAERKDVLSTFFGLLTLAAYARYVERPGLPRYLAILLLFALALLAKPMWVTLPVALLLLDYWPLGRLARSGRTQRTVSALARPLAEKLPLVALAGLFAVIAFGTEQTYGAVMPLDRLPFGTRLGNAVVACAEYLAQTAWPTKLAVYYPLMQRSAGAVLAAGTLLIAATALIAREARQRPYLAVGWLWFLGHLIPVLGLVQLGGYARADRYTYVPHIGLFVLVVWGLRDVVRRARTPRPALAASAGLVLAACTLGTVQQVRVWHDSRTLWTHTLKATSGNTVAHYNLGVFLADQGEPVEAALHFAAALEIQPHLAQARLHLASALVRQGRAVEAIAQFRRAVEEDPQSATAHALLAAALVQLGKPDDAINQYAAAADLDPSLAEVQHNLGQLLLQRGRVEDAMPHCAAAVRLRPQSADAHVNYGAALFRQGRWEEATQEYAAALEIDPGQEAAQANLGLAHEGLGVALARRGRFESAAEHLDAALRIAPHDAEAHHGLGLVREAQGRMEEALPHYRLAVGLQPTAADYHRSLAYALREVGQTAASEGEYRAATQLDPGWPAAACHTAWILATHPDPRHRNGALALRLAKQVCQAIQPPPPEALDVLAAAYAELTRFSEAVATVREACRRASAVGNPALVADVTGRLLLYERRRPFRDERLRSRDRQSP